LSERWYLYLAFFTGSALLHGALIENHDRLFGYGTFRYRSLSMLETMVWGDYFVCDTWRYRSRGPQQGFGKPDEDLDAPRRVVPHGISFQFTRVR